MACEETEINPGKQTCLQTYPDDPIMWCDGCNADAEAAKEALASGQAKD